MPLNRETVTSAERITLPLYMAACAAYGVVYLFDPRHNLDGIAGLTYQRSVLPMEAWGALFLTLAAVIGVARFGYHHRMLTAFALSMTAITWALWGAGYVVSIIMDPRVSLVAPILPWFVAGGCVASITMLVRRRFTE